MDTLHFQIDVLPPGLNGSGGQLRSFWAVRSRVNKQWQWLVLAAVRSPEGEVPHFTTRVRIAVVRHCKRRMDVDNLYSSLKPVLDALRQVGVIHDDSPKWIELQATQEIDRQWQGLDVIIEPLPAPEKKHTKREGERT